MIDVVTVSEPGTALTPLWTLIMIVYFVTSIVLVVRLRRTLPLRVSMFFFAIASALFIALSRNSALAHTEFGPSRAEYAMIILIAIAWFCAVSVIYDYGVNHDDR